MLFAVTLGFDVTAGSTLEGFEAKGSSSSSSNRPPPPKRSEVPRFRMLSLFPDEARAGAGLADAGADLAVVSSLPSRGPGGTANDAEAGKVSTSSKRLSSLPSPKPEKETPPLPFLACGIPPPNRESTLANESLRADGSSSGSLEPKRSCKESRSVEARPYTIYHTS